MPHPLSTVPTWISFPVSWKLEDVQAALNVIITALSSLAIFAFVRACWQRAAKNVAGNNDVPLYSLLSLNTLGEVFDVVFLLKHKLISGRYASICAQCLLVVFLSATAILSGPIARYSTRVGTVTQVQDVTGYIASRDHNGMGYANVEWNLTYDRLEHAGFPRDQLLDFVPTNTTNWIFEKSQWNNSWSLSCHHTPKTPIDLEVTTNCTNLRSELPGLAKAFSFTKWNDYSFSWGGFYNTPALNKDILLFNHATKSLGYDIDQETSTTMSFVLVATHLHQVPRAPRNSTECNFGPGKVESASYTKIECDMRRRDLSLDNFYDVAYPDTKSPKHVPESLTQYYQARFTRQSTSDSPITAITPDELIRFYQTYMIIKDIQYRHPITRPISVEVHVVQLSPAFLAIVLFVVVLTLISIGHYGIFALRHARIMSSTPQSKLDWMMQSIEVEDRPLTDPNCGLRRSVTIDSVNHMRGLPHLKRKEKEFEAARYGGRETTTWYLRDSPTVPHSDASSAMFRDGSVVRHGPAQIIQDDKKPMLKEVDLTDVIYLQK